MKQVKTLFKEMKTYFRKNTLLSVLGLIVVLFFIITRFYNWPYRMPFTWDQNQFSNQIWDIVKNKDFVLLGPRVNNDLGFFLAPYLTYLLIPIYLLTGLHPNALFIFVGIMNVLLVSGLLFVSTRIFSFKHAVFVLALWSINYLTIVYDTTPWWPIMIPIGTLYTIYAAYLLDNQLSQKVSDKKMMISWLIFGCVQGIFFHMHFQYSLMIIFSMLILGFIVYTHKIRLQKSIKLAIFSMMGFLATFAPLFIFDVRNQFLNSKLFLNFFFGPSVGDKDYSLILPVLVNFFHPYTFIKSVPLMLGLLALVIGGCLYLYKMADGFKKAFYFATGITLLLMLGVFSYYGKRPSEYYFIFSLPLVLIILSELTIRFKLNAIMTILIILMACNSFSKYQKLTQKDTRSLYYMDQTVQYLEKEIGKTGYNVSFSGTNVDNGFYYLLDYYGFQFTGDFEKDPLVRISAPPDEGVKASKEIGGYAIYIPENINQQNP